MRTFERVPDPAEVPVVEPPEFRPVQEFEECRLRRQVLVLEELENRSAGRQLA